MFVVNTISGYPPWFLSLYAIATIVLGALGFHVTNSLLKKEKTFAAVAQVVWSNVAAGFLATIGWDGTGYKRLLYAGTGTDWANHVSFPLTDFFTSPVFINLIWLEALLLIPYSILFIKWTREK